ncbi:MAG: hypothetical protein IKM51_02215 [Oscillospiraceae bacterium]|nr:hypothetical protein [Oscillospiraceae bacterium]
MKLKRLCALLLASSALVTLAACSKKTKEPENTPEPSVPILSDEDLFPGVNTSPAPQVSPEPSEEPTVSPEITVIPEAEVSSITEKQQFTAGDGTVVLELDISLPQVHSDNAPCDDINSFYLSQLEKQKIAAEAELLGRATQAYEQSVNMGAEFMPFYSAQEYETALNDKGYLSIVRKVTVFDGGYDLTVWSETFDLSNGGRLTLDDLFSAPDSAYLEVLSWPVKDMINADSEHYYPESANTFMQSFQKDDFCLSEEGIILYFQQGVISSVINGPEPVMIPYDTVKEIFRLW